MARNRQRAKERQAERRAARQAARGGSAIPGVTGDAPEIQPPPELGRSDYTLEHTTDEEEFIGDLTEFEAEPEEDGATAVAGPRGVRGGREHEEEHHHERGRV